MLKVIVPNNNIPERQYIVDVLLTEFLGLEYALETSDNQNDWSIFLDNGSSIVIRDAFFSRHKEPLSYLAESNIPSQVGFCKLEFSPEADMPVLFGKGALGVSDSSITCEVDIFAGAFFMLTRWEEYVNKARDAHDRFPAAESLAFKYGFLDRPIVNEYIELLWKLLVESGIEAARKIQGFRLVPTHDVDHIKVKKESFLRFVKRGLKESLAMKNPLFILEELARKFLVYRGRIRDECDTFDWLMDTSESAGLTSRFYFMGGGDSIYDNRYQICDPFVLNLASKIRSRNHIIGFHPSYNSYNNSAMFLNEKQKIERTLGVVLSEGRQHYLRFSVPMTWDVWEINGATHDSTCTYHDKEGFRCGTGNEFFVFNILKRKQLSLRERPLILMESSLFTYQEGLSLEDIHRSISVLIDKAKKYQFPFVFLWHNSSFLKDEKYFRNIYLHIIRAGVK